MTDLFTYQVTVPNTSPLVGKSLSSAALRQRHDSTLLGVKRIKSRTDDQFQELQLRANDILLLDVGKSGDINGEDFVSEFSEIHEIKAGIAKEYITEVQVTVSSLDLTNGC